MENEYIRPLAYIVRVEEVKPIDGYDRVQLARTRGWWCVVRKDSINEGDLAVYFEIDSKVPEADIRFKFLEKKNYKVKPQKMCGVISQGLLMPLNEFPELMEDYNIGDDVTKALGVTYAKPEDNIRKSTSDQIRKNLIKSKHKRFFKNKLVKAMMENPWFEQKIMDFFKKLDSQSIKVKIFPTHFDNIRKTDEIRIENCPNLLNYKEPLIVTEKLDGCSATYILERKSFNKFEFYVCSRNIRLDCDDSIYWEMAQKYDIENVLKRILRLDSSLKYVCIQGECVGKVQGNPLRLKENDLYVFNFITSSDVKFNSEAGKRFIEGLGLKWVPILDTEYYMPGDMETFKLYADGGSLINPNVRREGVVLRSFDATISFKNVSREYLLSKS